MSLIALVLLAILLGGYVGKNPDAISTGWLQLIKWGISISSLMWLGAGIFGILAVFLVYQSFFTVVKNQAEGNSIWFIDEETWVGENIVKYLGKAGGKILFFLEILLAVIILIL